jgi:signal transduction histidine kinase
LINAAFQHRSGRVISLSRLVLASVFLFAIWLDPSQPSRAPAEGYAILTAYALASAVQLGLTWNNWWLDRRLAAPAHMLDIAIFGVMVFLTEGYTSPFFTFFVFLILSATIRWGWRETALTAAAVIILFFGAGLGALNWAQGEFELRRLLIRGAYLVVLSLILIWFGLHQQGGRDRDMGAIDLQHPGEAIQALIRRALEYARARIGAKRIVFAWWDKEEPWVNVAVLAPSGFEQQRFGPSDFGEIVEAGLTTTPFLFERRTGRVLTHPGPGISKKFAAPIDSRFAARFDVQNGLAIPVETDECAGQLFALEVAGLCSDDLAVGKRVGEEISASLERISIVRVSGEAAETRTRLSLARDLHDSIAQLLAGTAFRLEAIRNAARSGRDIGPEIDSLQHALGQEQQDVRTLIARLRGARDHSGRTDICPGMRGIAERMSRQWQIECVLAECAGPIFAPAPLEHELHQVVREAVANAVRHGRASRVWISCRAGPDEIELDIEDNGSGFPEKGDFSDWNLLDEKMGPWSLKERVRSLGGTLALSSGNSGSRIRTSLPTERRA